MNFDDCAHRQPPVHVWEQLSAAFEILVDHGTGEPVPIDFEQNEAGSAGKSAIRDGGKLMPI
jgi:hypothetical protein